MKKRQLLLLFTLVVALPAWSTPGAQAQNVVQAKPNAMTNTQSTPASQRTLWRMMQSYADELISEKLPDAELMQSLAKEILAAKTSKSGVAVFERAPYVAIANEKLGLLFKIGGTAAELKAIYNGQTDFQFVRPILGQRPLWKVGTYSKSKWLDSLDNTLADAVSYRLQNGEKQATLEIEWKYAQPAVTVRTTMNLAPGANLSQWKIDVDNREANQGIGQIEFPVVRGVGKTNPQEEDYLAVPVKSGQLFSNPGRNAQTSEQMHMQYSAYYTASGSGLYIGTHDPVGHTKQTNILADSGTVATAYVYSPVGMGLPGYKYSLPGVIGAFKGDWYDASAIYKEWALKQKWVPDAPLYARIDIPNWLKENQVSLRADHDQEKELPQAEKFQEYFGMPVLLNWYTTHETGKDIVVAGSPDWSEKPLANLKATIARGRAKEMRGVVYSLVQLWDTRTETYKNIGDKVVMRDESGAPIFSPFGGLPMAAICHASKSVQDKYFQEMTDLARMYNISGVYADLGATYGNELCFATDHGHEPAAGYKSIEGQNEVLRRMREGGRKVNPEFIVMVEATDERVLKNFDTYLIYQGFVPGTSRNIPMFQTVYGEFVRAYGAKSAGIANEPIGAAYMAQLFAWGAQQGRVFVTDPATLQTNPTFSYYKYYANYRKHAMPYLGYGKMLRPLRIEYSTPILAANPALDYSIETASYQAPDKSIGFVFANTRISSEMKFSISIDPKEYFIPTDGSWSLFALDENGAMKERGAIRGVMNSEESVEKAKALILVAKPR